MRVILDKAETAWSLSEAVQTHHETFDFTAGAEEGVDLLFSGVEREVTNVKGGSRGELLFEIGGWGTICAGWRVVVTLAFLILCSMSATCQQAGKRI